MKLKGQQVKGAYVETVVIPRTPSVVVREDGSKEEVPNYHVFKLAAVLDYDDFEKLCPQPDPPLIQYPGGKTGKNVEDSKYKKAQYDWSMLRYTWAFLKSLQATPDLEWETVDYGKPETWQNYEKELKDAGFSVNEIGRIITGFHIANNMDETKMEAARKHFLAQEQVQPVR